MKYKIIYLLILCCITWSCQNKNQAVPQKTKIIEFQNKGHQLVYEMTEKVGTPSTLYGLKDVTYTYTYTTPDGKEDISTEKYVFDGELSYAAYKKHERTLPELEGLMEQGYDGQTFWLRDNGQYLQDEKQMKRVIFNRKTNYYWFTMMQKLLDPGLTYEYAKKDTVDGNYYDVVKVSFNSNNEKPTDIYQLYINKETKLVDQFLFTVADFNVIETPFLMKMEYEEIDGMLLPTKREYTKSTWDAENLNENWIQVSWTDIQFNTGVSRGIFERKE